jgi:hypothetical protein
MTLNNVNVTGWDQLDFTFYFYPNSMENGEDFWVRVNDGSGWQTVATYARGTHFNNGSFYTATVTMSSNDFSFNSGFDFRIQCDASTNSDQIYIDAVTLTGINNSRNDGSTTQTITLIGSQNAAGEEAESNANALIDLFDGDELMVYPNPARDHINLISNSDAEYVRIYSVTGVLVAEHRLDPETVNRIDITRLDAGTYIVHLQMEDEVIYEKFIKQ